VITVNVTTDAELYVNESGDDWEMKAKIKWTQSGDSIDFEADIDEAHWKLRTSE
jgi:hypothetical protein